ncbi:MAG: DUF3426 domain-containing protein [Rhizomicrobium sp.]
MILSCPNCSTRYQVDKAKFPPDGRQVRCAKCGYRWHQNPPLDDPGDESLLQEPQTDGDADAAAFAEPEEDAAAREAELSQSPAAVAEEPVVSEEASFRRFATDRSADEGSGRAPLFARLLILFGWGVLIVAVLGLGWCAYVYRQNIMTNWPQSASLYSALGLKSAAGALKFDATNSRQVVEDGKAVLEVSGTLTNPGDHEVLLPSVRVSLSDGAYREVYHWTFSLQVLTLKPGQSTRFATKLSSPPAAARHLELRFAKAGE